MLVFIGYVDEEGHNRGVPLHQLHHKVEAQMHTLTDQAFMPGRTAADQAIQRLHHHLALGLVTLHQTEWSIPWASDCIAASLVSMHHNAVVGCNNFLKFVAPLLY